MRILVTGASGFVGKNLISILQLDKKNYIYKFDKENNLDDLKKLTKNCDFVVHLAGVNRPKDPKEFYEVNTDLTTQLCEALKTNGNPCPILVSSSIQAESNKAYGKSKKHAEDVLLKFGKENSNPIYIYRFKNLFGKWSRPNYNSVVATWCYNIARDLEITINDPATELELCYIDDVVDEIIARIETRGDTGYYKVNTTDIVTLGELYEVLSSFKESRKSFHYPDQSKPIYKKLYATYLNFLPTDNFSYPLISHTDERGSFTEVLKDSINGQVSVNISKPSVTKGQHWHSTKNEKFLVIQGDGVIRFRDIFSDEVIEYPVNGERLEVIDVPTGYTHSLVNVGDSDMVTLIWANELFDDNKPDTNYLDV